MSIVIYIMTSIVYIMDGLQLSEYAFILSPFMTLYDIRFCC